MNYSNNLMPNRKKTSSAMGAIKPTHRKHIHALAVFSVVVGLVALLTPSHEAEAKRDPSGGERHMELALPMPGEAAESTSIMQPTQQASISPRPAASTEPSIAAPEADPQTSTPISTTTSSPQAIADSPAELSWETVEVRSGDSLSVIFSRLKLSPQQLHAVVNADKQNNILTRLRPGQRLDFQIDQEGQLQAIRFNISSTRTLEVSRTEDGFSSTITEQELESRLAHASGVIESSLFNAGLAAGLSDNVIMELANIFGWDVDFALDIRRGDSFSVLYEQLYLNGEKLRDGRILAAQFNNRNREFQAVLFTDSEGRSQYYSPEGRSMRKAFLRAPVDFHRISSGFQPSRFHPVLGERRPHRGVDYAAPTGTPIRAAGDGRVIFRGVQGGYGNTVIIQHGNNITTLYAHMSRFQQGVTNGTRVRQGQIIGYVGMTGLATGPHLHYEFRVNGVHQNPLTVKLPDAEPIPAKYREQFKQQSLPLLAQLETLTQVQVAASE